MSQYGYISVFLLIALENLFPPIPSEIVLTFGGFLTTYTKLTIPGVVVFATAGSVVGAIIIYEVGSLLNIRQLENIIGQWGHILRVKQQDLHTAGSWFKRYGYWTVFFCRMIPIVRSLISIPAGMAKMKLGIFLIFTTVGTLIWNILLVWSGALLGESWEQIVRFLNLYSEVTLIGLILVAVVFIFVKRR